MTDCGCTNFPASLGNVTFEASVGIGTTDPAAPLHIQLNAPNVVALVDTAATDQSSQFALGEQGELVWQIYKPGGNQDLRFYRSSGSNMGDQLTIQDSTDYVYVGIGTSAPMAALYVQRDTANVQVLVDTAVKGQSSQFVLGEAGELIWQIYKPGDSCDLRFYRTGVGDQLTIQDVTGRVGIGTNTPQQALDVVGTVSASGAYLAGSRTVADSNGCYYA